MEATLFKRVFLRFARVFAGGFIAALILTIQQQPDIIDFSTLLKPLFFAGLVGGLMAVDKALRG